MKQPFRASIYTRLLGCVVACSLLAGVWLVAEAATSQPGTAHQRGLENYNLAYATQTGTSTSSTKTSTTTTTTKTSSPTIGQILSALGKSLTPSGGSSSITAILHNGGYTVTFSAPGAGTITIMWYYLPPGAKLPSVKHKAVLVATGKRTVDKAETVKIKVKLTGSGRKLLKHSSKIKLTALGSFKSGSKHAGVKKSFTLKKH